MLTTQDKPHSSVVYRIIFLHSLDDKPLINLVKKDNQCKTTNKLNSPVETLGTTNTYDFVTRKI